MRALRTFAWRAYLFCTDGDLVIGHVRTLKGKRESFTSTVLNSLSNYFRSPIDIPERFEVDLFWYQTRGEMEFERNLMDVTDDQINRWRILENGEVEVCDDLYIAKRP